MKKLLFGFALLSLIVSCESEATIDEVIPTIVDTTLATTPKETSVDSSTVEVIDTNATGTYQEESTTEASLSNALQSTVDVEEVEEGKLSFCDCVKKQKKLNDTAIETEDDAVFESTMKELKEMRAGDCKILFAKNINTIDEKQAHQRRVNRCLQN